MAAYGALPGMLALAYFITPAQTSYKHFIEACKQQQPEAH